MLSFTLKDLSVAASVSMSAATYDELCCGRLTLNWSGSSPIEPIPSLSLIQSLSVSTSPNAKSPRYSDRSGSEGDHLYDL
jgi:hypothetical protein